MLTQAVGARARCDAHLADPRDSGKYPPTPKENDKTYLQTCPVISAFPPFALGAAKLDTVDPGVRGCSGCEP